MGGPKEDIVMMTAASLCVSHPVAKRKAQGPSSSQGESQIFPHAERETLGSAHIGLSADLRAFSSLPLN